MVVLMNIFIYALTLQTSLSIPLESCSVYYGVRIKSYDNKKISQSMMWTMNNLTKAGCLAECYKEKYCFSVHFSPLEPVCVAFRERFDGVSVATLDEPGYQLLETKKPISVPGSYCEFNLDCVTLGNSHCHQSVCRCDRGYGLSGTTCRSLLTCTAFDDTFTMYETSVINGNDIDSSGGNTAETCQQFCRNNLSCKSADLHGGMCFLNGKTWLEVSAAGRDENRAGCDFYQRDCKIW